MPSRFKFDPDQVAWSEVAGWKAYYDRDWVTLIRLIIGLCQQQFLIPFPYSLLAAYYTVRASAAWAPVEHDERMVRWFLERFYRVAHRWSLLTFDPVRVSELELTYWDLHRRFAGKPDKSALIQSVVELHSALFQLTAEQARESAVSRVDAANILATITGLSSTDPELDWKRTEASLRRCYQSIERQLANARANAQ